MTVYDWRAARDAEKQRATGAPGANGAIPVATEGATRYALAALEAECAELAAMAPNTGRNPKLNQAAYRMARHIGAGSIDHHTVRDALQRAAQACRLPQHEIDTVLRDNDNGALLQGQTNPRYPTERTPLWDPTGISPSTAPPGTANSAPTRGTTTPDAAASATQTSPDDPDAAELLRLHRARAVAAEVERQRAYRDARHLLDSEDAAATFRAPPSRHTLTDELALPDEPVAYAIDRILPVGGNVLLAAQFKTGKTTLVNNLARALADGNPFLGKFTVAPRPGRVALFNYEVDERQYRAWLRAVGIRNTDNVSVLNLRGYRLPLTAGSVEDWTVDWLTDHNITSWILDPFARAFVGAGKSENDNTEVGAFLDTLDVIKKRAGVEELIMPTHTGRTVFDEGEERARGATRLDDWPDVRWVLTSDDNDIRYFRATGRDVEVAEEKLTWDPATRGLTFGGGDRAWERRGRLEQAVVQAVTAEPGMSMAKLRMVVRGLAGKAENTAIDAAAAGAHRGHLIRVQQDGQALRHYPPGLAPYDWEGTE